MVLTFLADHPYTIGKNIASATGISEPDVSKTLSKMESMGIVTNKINRTKEGKNYTGKHWWIILDFPTLEKILPIIADTDYELNFLQSNYCLVFFDEVRFDENAKSRERLSELFVEQQQKVVDEINRLMIRYHNFNWREHEIKDYEKVLGLLQVVPKMFPPYIDSRKISAALLSHDKIFQFQRLYYNTKIAPYNQAIEDAKTEEESKKAIKEKEWMENQIFINDFTIRSLNTNEMKDCTADERTWVNFFVEGQIKHAYKTCLPR